jgi:hypothetical protein
VEIVRTPKVKPLPMKKTAKKPFNGFALAGVVYRVDGTALKRYIEDDLGHNAQDFALAAGLSNNVYALLNNESLVLHGENLVRFVQGIASLGGTIEGLFTVDNHFSGLDSDALAEVEDSIRESHSTLQDRISERGKKRMGRPIGDSLGRRKRHKGQRPPALTD